MKCSTEKNFIFYALNTSVFEEIMLWVSQFTGAGSSGEAENNDKDENNQN